MAVLENGCLEKINHSNSANVFEELYKGDVLYCERLKFLYGETSFTSPYVAFYYYYNVDEAYMINKVKEDLKRKNECNDGTQKSTLIVNIMLWLKPFLKEVMVLKWIFMKKIMNYE